VWNCDGVANSPIRGGVKETYEYFNALAVSRVGTAEEQELSLAMAEILTEYVISPQLIEDCWNAFVQAVGAAGECAWYNCTEPSCDGCCVAERTENRNDCSDKYPAVGWIERIIWGDPHSHDRAECLFVADIKYDLCGSYCNHVPINPACEGP
jgi:hypothetical protein